MLKLRIRAGQVISKYGVVADWPEDSTLMHRPPPPIAKFDIATVDGLPTSRLEARRVPGMLTLAWLQKAAGNADAVVGVLHMVTPTGRCDYLIEAAYRLGHGGVRVPTPFYVGRQVIQ